VLHLLRIGYATGIGYVCSRFLFILPVCWCSRRVLREASDDDARRRCRRCRYSLRREINRKFLQFITFLKNRLARCVVCVAVMHSLVVAMYRRRSRETKV